MTIGIDTRVLHHSRNEFGTVEGMSYDEYGNPFADVRWDSGEILLGVDVSNLLVIEEAGSMGSSDGLGR